MTSTMMENVMENVIERGEVMEMDEAVMENDDEFKENTPLGTTGRKPRGGPSLSVRKVVGLCSKTKGNQKKEDRNVNVLMIDDKFEE